MLFFAEQKTEQLTMTLKQAHCDSSQSSYKTSQSTDLASLSLRNFCLMLPFSPQLHFGSKLFRTETILSPHVQSLEWLIPFLDLGCYVVLRLFKHFKSLNLVSKNPGNCLDLYAKYWVVSNIDFFLFFYFLINIQS